jgi:hypothetical protein
MNTKETTSRAHANGATRIHWNEIARRVKSGISELPSNLEGHMKSDPYAALGIAAALGLGVGVILGSRILRAALTSAATYAVVDLVRTYILERMPTVNGTQIAHVTESIRATPS